MSKCFPATVAAAMMLMAVPTFAQDAATHERESDLVKGKTVSIEGCVAQGQKENTFVLGSVLELPTAPVDTGRKRIYWMKPNDVKGHVGQRVQITGQVSDLERSEIEVEQNTPLGAVATIAGPGGANVTVPAEVIGMPRGIIGALTGSAPKEIDVPITLVKLKVDNVKAVSGTCP
jgi:hypothetical protein